MLANTPIFVRLGGLEDFRDTLTVALITYAATQNLPISAASSVAAEVRKRLRKLRGEQLVVIETLRQLSGGAPYQIWVRQKPLLKALVHAELPGHDSKTACLRLLRAMKDQQILDEAGQAWRARW